MVQYHVLPDDPLAALNILREAPGWIRCLTCSQQYFPFPNWRDGGES
jgi:hypothetical protein